MFTHIWFVKSAYEPKQTETQVKVALFAYLFVGHPLGNTQNPVS